MRDGRVDGLTHLEKARHVHLQRQNAPAQAFDLPDEIASPPGCRHIHHGREMTPAAVLIHDHESGG